MAKENKRRSPNAQIAAMRRLWPQFEQEKRPNGLLIWRGFLRPKAQSYLVGVIWKPGLLDLPYAFVIDPPIRPRPGAIYEEIPHLIFDEADPKLSGLCLFDPDGREWSESDLIAETTVHWISEWLLYYEL